MDPYSTYLYSINITLSGHNIGTICIDRCVPGACLDNLFRNINKSQHLSFGSYQSAFIPIYSEISTNRNIFLLAHINLLLGSLWHLPILNQHHTTFQLNAQVPGSLNSTLSTSTSHSLTINHSHNPAFTSHSCPSLWASQSHVSANPMPTLKMPVVPLDTPQSTILAVLELQ